MMTEIGRAQAIYDRIKINNPMLAMLQGDVDKSTYLDANNKSQPSEKYALMQSLLAVFGSDLIYIKANAVVSPGTLQADSTACTVTTSTGPASGFTVAKSIITSVPGAGGTIG